MFDGGRLRAHLQLETLEDRMLLTGGLVNTGTALMPTASQTALVQSATPVKPLRLADLTPDQQRLLERIYELASTLEALTQGMIPKDMVTADMMADPMASGDATTISGWDQVFSQLQGMWNQIAEGVQAEMERTGLSGMFGHLFQQEETGAAGVFETGSSDPLADLLGELAQQNNFEATDLVGISSVPGLTYYKGQDVLNSDGRPYLSLVSSGCACPSVRTSSTSTTTPTTGTSSTAPPLPEPELDFGINKSQAEQLEALEKNETKKYEDPNAPAKEPITFDPQDIINQFTTPGMEGETNGMLDRAIAKMVQAIAVGFGKVNPNPEGPSGGGSEGDGPGNPGEGIVGGDPVDENPLVNPTSGKGPNPIVVGGPSPVPGGLTDPVKP